MRSQPRTTAHTFAQGPGTWFSNFWPPNLSKDFVWETYFASENKGMGKLASALAAFLGCVSKVPGDSGILGLPLEVTFFPIN